MNKIYRMLIAISFLMYQSSYASDMEVNSSNSGSYYLVKVSSIHKDDSGKTEFNGTLNQKPLSAISVSFYIVEKTKCDALKLHKLLYFCQKEALKGGNPLFQESIEAWVHGPVVPEVYKKHRSLTKLDSTMFSTKESLCDEQKQIMDLVIKRFEETSSWDLRNLSHQEPAWLAARIGLGPDDPSHNVITLNMIKESLAFNQRGYHIYTSYGNYKILQVFSLDNVFHFDQTERENIRGIDMSNAKYFNIGLLSLINDHFPKLKYLSLKGADLDENGLKRLLPLLYRKGFQYLDICQTLIAESPELSLYLTKREVGRKIIFIDQEYLEGADSNKELNFYVKDHYMYYQKKIWLKK